ncbi:orotidine 5'-phosphate decarboxylase, partial [bacterium]|nr:orotidine 5'-phosphate decarboxylase [bacterium]
MPEVIVALDVEDGRKALKLVNELKGKVGFFKLGSRLFTAEGP